MTSAASQAALAPGSSPNGAPTPGTLVYLVRRPAVTPAQHHLIAGELGFDTWVVGLNDIQVRGSDVVVRSGHRVAPGCAHEVISQEMAIRPDLIIHRCAGRGAAVRKARAVRRVNPLLRTSLHPARAWFADKCWMERALRLGDERGIHVRRPLSVILGDRDSRELAYKLAFATPLIIKPPRGSMCLGISISRPDELGAAADFTARRGRALVQQIVPRPALLGGHAFDLRVFFLVDRVLDAKFVTYQEGVARVAAQPKGGAATRRNTLTGCSFQKRLGLKPRMLPASEALRMLAAEGYDVSRVWPDIEDLFRRVLLCVADAWMGTREDDARYFLLIGADILLQEEQGRRLVPVFLEGNTQPQLNRWSVEADAAVASVHRHWLQALASMRRI